MPNAEVEKPPELLAFSQVQSAYRRIPAHTAMRQATRTTTKSAENPFATLSLAKFLSRSNTDLTNW